MPINMKSSEFALPSRYTMEKVVGRGSCGLVASARSRDGEFVAIKKLNEPFGNERRATRVLRETKLLQQFTQHPNLLGLRDIFVSEDLDIYMVAPLMDTDLHRVIASNQPLSEQHVQWFTFQLLSGLSYMHKCSVLHRDIKPSNLLVNENCELRITDFGLSRAIEDDDVEAPLTEYVVTRWYRAPELVLGCASYTQAVDMWSAGCILAELLNRRPLLPGDNQMDQLRRILRLCGTQRLSDIPAVPLSAERFMASLSEYEGTPFSELCPTASEDALALLRQLLCWAPIERGSAAEALQSQFLEPFRDHIAKVDPVQPAEPCFHSQHDDLLDARMSLLCEILCWSASSEGSLDSPTNSPPDSPEESNGRFPGWRRGEEISAEVIRSEAVRRLVAFDRRTSIGGCGEECRRQLEDATVALCA